MILDKIIKDKEQYLLNKKNKLPLNKLLKLTAPTNVPSFYDALKSPGLSIIGEIKKASPSKGILKENLDVIALAKEYNQSVDCISILTEPNYFLGNIDFIPMVLPNINIPILRKDFITDEYEIYESKYLGASAVLLIVRILDEKTLKKFIDICNELKIDALVEINSKEDLDKALKCNAKIIGINNRDLADFSTSFSKVLELAPLIPRDKIIVCESGIFSSSDIKTLNQVRFDACLIGEAFMKCDSIKNKSKELKNAYKA